MKFRNLGNIHLREVGVREISIIIRTLLLALAKGLRGILIPPTCFLHDFLPPPKHLFVTLDLISNRISNSLERVDVLYFYFCSEYIGFRNRNIRLNAHFSLFHVCIGRTKIAQEEL